MFNIPKPVSVLESIESTAVKLFAERGIKDVTIKDIAYHAKCSEGALYRHYKSKEEMAWSLYKREVENFGRLVKDILNDDSLSVEKKIYSAIELFFNFYDKSPTKFSFILLSQYNFPRERKINQMLNPYQQMEELLNDINRKKKKVDNKLLTGMIFGLILEPARMRSVSELKGKLTDRTDLVYKAVMNIVNINPGI